MFVGNADLRGYCTQKLSDVWPFVLQNLGRTINGYEITPVSDRFGREGRTISIIHTRPEEQSTHVKLDFSHLGYNLDDLRQIEVIDGDPSTSSTWTLDFLGSVERRDSPTSNPCLHQSWRGTDGRICELRIALNGAVADYSTYRSRKILSGNPFAFAEIPTALSRVRKIPKAEFKRTIFPPIVGREILLQAGLPSFSTAMRKARASM